MWQWRREGLGHELWGIAVFTSLAIAALIAVVLHQSAEPAPPPQTKCPNHARVGLPRGARLEHSLALIDARPFPSCNGTRAVRARYAGAVVTPSSARTPGYARAVYPLRWRRGETLRYGATFFLPRGFHSHLGGQVSVLRWDNYPSRTGNTDYGGVVIDGSDGLARLVRSQNGGPQVELTTPFDIPEGRWIKLVVHQRLGENPPDARNLVYLDGSSIRRSHEVNTDSGQEVLRMRFGLVALSIKQAAPLALWFEDPMVVRSP